MRVLIFGATGMVGQSVLRECLDAHDVTRAVSVGRTPTAVADLRFTELLIPDLFDLSPIAGQLAPFDACFFRLGVSSVGMAEAEYTRITRHRTFRH